MTNSTLRKPISSSSSASNAVQLENVVKSFGTTKALNGLTLTLEKGEIHALLGPNGAGKTTAIAIMTGLRKADLGSVSILGGDPGNNSIRLRIGLTPQESGFPDNLRVSEILRLVRSHFPAPMSNKDLFKRFSLESIYDKQAGSLSGGQQRALAVALSFAGNPDLVFLDEPTTGLDLETRQKIWEAILNYRQSGGTVVLTTHYLEEAEFLATKVAVVHQGKDLINGTLDHIRELVGISRVSFRGNLSESIEGANHVEFKNGRVIIMTYNSDQVVRSLVQRGVSFQGLQIRPANLEEAFIKLIGESDQK